MAHLYRSLATVFPDGTKIRLIPPINTIISQVSKEKYGLVVARQEALIAKLGVGTSWEFSQNLLLDHKGRGNAIMGINSSKFQDHSVFHSIDPTWGTDNGGTFTFHPDNEAEARMYIAGLIPYIRDTFGEQYLNIFNANAVDRHSDSVFNPITKRIYSNTVIWVNNSLSLDAEWNLMATPNEPKNTDSSDSSESTETGETPAIFKETDSISTFHTKGQEK